MVDNNKEKVNSAENNDNSVSPEVLEEAKVYLAEEKAAEAREFIRDEEIKADGKFLHYTKVILSGILDQIFVIALALVVFGIFDLALRVFGYRVALREEVFMIIYVISNILYYPILQEVLHGKTLGKKFIFR
ncbi:MULTISPECIES: hypothetical protein [Clostridia]|uniref:RDD family protein n=1 Tax=Clostridium saudiense TaxID=1414720 RepID=A0ABS2FDJ3_9CLOT|nr:MULTISPECIES: hypothetical protein [Clostridiaceae]MBM6818615.1 hypothetical protein [Clostridium saudiense]